MKLVNSHGLVNGTGEVLGAETGEESWGNIRQEGPQFDLVPKLDEGRVLHVLLGQRRRFRLTKSLLKVGHHLSDALENKQNKETQIFTIT